MEKLTLNFFGEKVDIDIPKTFDTLKHEISEKFAFSPSETADILISYVKDLGTKIIDTEKDFTEFISNKIKSLDLDIKQDSKLYLDSLDSIKNQVNSDHTKLEELLKKQKEISEEKKKLLEIQKKEVEKFNKEYKKEAKKKLEIIKKMNENLKKIKTEKHLQTKKIQEHTKELEKTENETITQIVELQKKLGLPVTIEAKKTLRKKPIVKKCKKITKKVNKKVNFVEKQFEGVNNVINKMIEKVNKLVNIELKKEKENVEKKEKEVHESKIILKPEEEKGFIDFKKLSEYITNEIYKWTNFVMCHTNELTEALSKKYKESKGFLTPVEEKLKGKKKLEEEEKKEIHHYYICDGCEMNPIKGIRYHCKDCPDFDFCENCYKNKKIEHKHNFEEIKKSIDPAPVKNELAVHLGVACDGCGMYPIIGNRFKCAVCKNFDYCEKCEEKFCEKEHLHPFIKIYSPQTKIASIKCVVDENCPDYQNKKK